MTTFNTENCKKLIADLTYAKDTNFDLEGNWIDSISNNSKKQLDMLFSIVDDKYSKSSLAIDLIKDLPIYLNEKITDFNLKNIEHQLKYNCFNGFNKI